MKDEQSINNFFLRDGQTALPKHLSLFNGIGGFQLAADWVGWENVAHVEIDEWCNRIVKQHFPKSICYTDIRKFDGTKFRGTIDIISGGFPCQPFSVAGKQGEIKPAFIVGENVFGIVSISLDTVLSDLEALGYTTETFIVPACAVNAPHRRDRVWIIGYTEHAGFNGTENGEGSNQGSNGDQEGTDKIRQPARPTLSRDAIENPNGFRCNGTSTNGRGAKYDFNSTWTEVASEFCRVDDGIPNRVDRIKGLGNAIVPQIAFEIFKCIDTLIRKDKNIL